MRPAYEVELLCPPYQTADRRVEGIVGLLEAAVGERLAYEFTPYAEFRPVLDLASLVEDSLLGRRWADPTLILVNGQEQDFVAYISKVDGRTVGAPSQPSEWGGALWLALRVPMAALSSDPMDLLMALAGLTKAEVGTVGPVLDTRDPGSALFSRADPARMPLAWLNVWSARIAAYHGFPGPGDDERLAAITWSPERTHVVVKVTADPLDPGSQEHRAVIAWFDARFSGRSPRQS